ncbi:UNVERIFIED_CONTAM: hypothetical protein FKN15_064075 [Acipenser sinensis]
MLHLGDSETTEDEAAEPQIGMATKEGPRGPQDQAVHRVPAGRTLLLVQLRCCCGKQEGLPGDELIGRESEDRLQAENQQLLVRCQGLEAGLCVKEAELQQKEKELCQKEAELLSQGEEQQQVAQHWKERWQEAAVALRSKDEELEEAHSKLQSSADMSLVFTGDSDRSVTLAQVLPWIREAKPSGTVSPHHARANPAGQLPSEFKSGHLQGWPLSSRGWKFLTCAVEFLGVKEEAGSVVGSEDAH